MKEEILPKILPAKIATQRRFVSNYVALLSGLLRLTDTELLVIVEIVWAIYTGKDKETVFSAEGRGAIRDILTTKYRTMSVQNFNNYLMALKKKGAVIQTEEGYDINPWLFPRKEITFKYQVYEELDKYIQHNS